MSNNIESTELNLLCFNIGGGHKFAVDVMKLRGIVKPEHLNQLPAMGSYILGVMQDRGDSVPVIDTWSILDMRGVPNQSINGEQMVVIIEGDDGPVGLMIESASEIVRTLSSKIAKNYKQSGANNLLSMIVEADDNDLLSVIDIDAVLHKAAA